MTLKCVGCVKKKEMKNESTILKKESLQSKEGVYEEGKKKGMKKGKDSILLGLAASTIY